ncbi:Crp/Fnr family transcriptional regulator [Marinifilum sp. RC60d5]|uniref:Crp/Fnr family transcriptional regulator n=1 Tax=Marinifilum sp. RC60d5 TaxID=3458414 RepID=UPI0040356088
MQLKPVNKIHPNCQICDDKSCAVKNLMTHEIKQLGRSCTEVTFDKGDEILTESSSKSHIIYLREGLVKQFTKTENNKEYILQIVKEDTYLGLYSMFNDSANHFYYKALTPVHACYIEWSVFSQLIKENGRFGYEILSMICNTTLNSYSYFIDQDRKKIFGKVADALLYFSQIIFDSEEFNLPLNRKEIASMIGASRESVSKQMTSFENDKIISVTDANVTILDMEKLMKISKLA